MNDDRSDAQTETRRLEELWTRYVERAPLSVEERAQLATAFARDEVFRRRLVADLQFDGALRAAAELERGQEHVVEAVRALVTAAGRTEEVVAAVRRRIEAKTVARASASKVTPMRRARGIVVAAVLLAGSAAAMVVLRTRPERPSYGPISGPVVSSGAPATGVSEVSGTPTSTPTRGPALPAGGAPAATARALARLETVAGTVYRQGADGTRRAAPSLELGSGDWVWTSGASARARLVADDSRVDIEGDAVAGLTAGSPDVNAADNAGVRVFLAHGRLTGVVRARPSGPAMVFASPHAIVRGAGTVRLDVGASLTRVEVKEGRARVSALGVQRGSDIEAGQFALVSADDLKTSQAPAFARQALLLTGPDDTKEGAAAPDGLRASEHRLKARLEGLGFEVTVADAADVPSARARTVALLVLSSSVSAQYLGPWFAQVPVPMLVLESTAWEQLGLTGLRWRHDVGPTGLLTDIVITDPGHPLAAGLSGNVRLLSLPLGLRWAAPPDGARVIATYPGAAGGAAVLFAFERGAVTTTGVAPARRVGLPLGNGRVIRALTEPGWRLVDAAVLWAVGG